MDIDAEYVKLLEDISKLQGAISLLVADWEAEKIVGHPLSHKDIDFNEMLVTFHRVEQRAILLDLELKHPPGDPSLSKLDRLKRLLQSVSELGFRVIAWRRVLHEKQSKLVDGDMIDLDQAAALVNRSKRTLERAQKDRKANMPPPAIQGAGGKKSEWKYAELRPWLETQYGRNLPSRPPHATR